MSKADLDISVLNKTLQAPSFGGGCVIPITVSYCTGKTVTQFMLSLREYPRVSLKSDRVHQGGRIQVRQVGNFPDSRDAFNLFQTYKDVNRVDQSISNRLKE